MKKIVFGLFFMFIFIQLATSATYPEQPVNTQVTLIIPCLNSTYSNLTMILSPSNSTTGSIQEINGEYEMTKLGSNYNFSYNFKTLGTYYVYGHCDENGIDLPWQYDVPVATSTNSLTIFIALTSIAFIFLILSIFIDFEYFLYVSGILFILSGIYLMIFGFGNITNLYTRGLAIVLTASGLLFIVGAYENYGTTKNDEEE